MIKRKVHRCYTVSQKAGTEIKLNMAVASRSTLVAVFRALSDLTSDRKASLV